MNTEDSVPNEKKVVYDIHFYAYTPDEKGKVKIILDVEAQKKYHTGHDFVTRGFFYTSRIISAQLGKEFVLIPSRYLKRIFHIYHFLEKKHFYQKNLVVKRISSLSTTNQITKTASYEAVFVALL